MGGVGNFYDQPVGRLGDAADFDAVERAAQRFAQFVQEETAIAALEPQLVVMNDNVRRRHHSRWPSQADARSIQPPASGIAGKVVALGWIAPDRQAPRPIPQSRTNASKPATRARNKQPRNGFDTSGEEMSRSVRGRVYR